MLSTHLLGDEIFLFVYIKCDYKLICVIAMTIVFKYLMRIKDN